MDILLLLPVFVLVLLTAIIWLLMYVRRIHEIKLKKIDLQNLATHDLASTQLTDVIAADNFSNLLETPVLFYALVPLLLITDTATDAQLALAWIFVLLRIAHSIIHVTYNNVFQRWLVYITSTFCIFSMWILFAISIFESTG